MLRPGFVGPLKRVKAWQSSQHRFRPPSTTARADGFFVTHSPHLGWRIPRSERNAMEVLPVNDIGKIPLPSSTPKIQPPDDSHGYRPGSAFVVARSAIMRRWCGPVLPPPRAGHGMYRILQGEGAWTMVKRSLNQSHEKKPDQ